MISKNKNYFLGTFWRKHFILNHKEANRAEDNRAENDKKFQKTKKQNFFPQIF